MLISLKNGQNRNKFAHTGSNELIVTFTYGILKVNLLLAISFVIFCVVFFLYFFVCLFIWWPVCMFFLIYFSKSNQKWPNYEFYFVNRPSYIRTSLQTDQNWLLIIRWLFSNSRIGVFSATSGVVTDPNDDRFIFEIKSNEYKDGFKDLYKALTT